MRCSTATIRLRRIARETKAKIVWFGSDAHIEPFQLELIGIHNHVNAQAAYLAARELGITREAAGAVLKSFRGLPHRLQVVHEQNGVRWVNDSIATIPQAAMAACEAFADGTVIQIVGGYDKQLEMGPMCERLARRCKAVLTIGSLGPELTAMMRKFRMGATRSARAARSVAPLKRRYSSRARAT